MFAILIKLVVNYSYQKLATRKNETKVIDY